jgi:hypothetical protein
VGLFYCEYSKVQRFTNKQAHRENRLKNAD